MRFGHSGMGDVAEGDIQSQRELRALQDGQTPPALPRDCFRIAMRRA